MGAKTPEQINKVRPSVKCDACGRKFLNVSALKSHFKFLHVLKTDTPKRVRKTPLRKKVVPVHMLKRVNPSPESKQENKTEATDKSQDLAGKPTTATKKPEFECPVCEEKFPVYFTAFRHIQKNHCVDENGEKVLPNSPQLVKPIRIEMCASCRMEIRSSELHNCPKQQSNRDQYMCLGCKQVFSGLVLFQHHVKGLHADGAQNYFFPTQDVFTSWKTDLQEQAKIELIRLNKQKSKEIYHCSHHSALSDTATTKLCPSTITAREYTKGIHVCYYKEHHGHTVDNVQLNKYNQYCISFYTREAEDLQLEDAEDNDLYLQFKKMVTCIVFDAAKVDLTTLKQLLGKALEMTTLLKHYQSEDHSTPLISKCLTDAQITRTLGSLKSMQRKRKHSPIVKETKKIEAKEINVKKVEVKKVEAKKIEAKKVKQTPSIEKTISSSVENGITSRLRSSPAVKRKSPMLIKSVSFSKSVPKTIEGTPQKSKSMLEMPQKITPMLESPQNITPMLESPQKITPMLEMPVKSTPMLEMPAKSTSKLKIEVLPQKSLPKTVDVELESKKQEVSAPPTPVPRSLLQSPSSFNDSYKHFVDQNFKCNTTPNTSTPRPKTNVKKKEVVKTKIGQFKVKPTTTSPKESSPKSPKVTKEVKEVPIIPKTWKAKEMKYEVKEQENDCNILILKL